MDRLKQYFYLTRFDKPIGILLLLWPTLMALWLASNGHPNPNILLVFCLGTVLMRDTSNQNPAQAATNALAQATNTPDAVQGTGEIDSVRYGNVLRARKLVNIRGAGLTYDGTFYVKSVTHTITRGDYKQSFSVSREGTGSLLPVVAP